MFILMMTTNTVEMRTYRLCMATCKAIWYRAIHRLECICICMVACCWPCCSSSAFSAAATTLACDRMAMLNDTTKDSRCTTLATVWLDFSWLLLLLPILLSWSTAVSVCCSEDGGLRVTAIVMSSRRNSGGSPPAPASASNDPNPICTSKILSVLITASMLLLLSLLLPAAATTPASLDCASVAIAVSRCAASAASSSSPSRATIPRTSLNALVNLRNAASRWLLPCFPLPSDAEDDTAALLRLAHRMMVASISLGLVTLLAWGWEL
mmetsp:Transcript_21281/g.60739  ORF Transcript_21281/g.60739 Transcript_21281/m.60739 type:complete len:267 (+) Transcript_21281:510-1310(+)